MENPAPASLTSAASRLFAEAPLLVRLRQRGRPRICPYELLIEQVPAGSSVLDVGCGSGLFLGLLDVAGKLSRGLGLDASAGAIAAAQAMAQRRPHLEFRRLDVTGAWPAGEYDIVSMVDLMHHLPLDSRAAVFAQAAAHLAPGGRLIYKDMVARPRWRALANRLHDLAVSRQWIREVPVADVERWAIGAGLRLAHARRIDRLCYGHDLRVFTRGT